MGKNNAETTDPATRIQEIKKNKKALIKRGKDSNSELVLRQIGIELDELNDELEELRENQEQRSTPPGQLNVFSTYGVQQPNGEMRNIGSFNVGQGAQPVVDNRPHGSEEYRQAFWNQMKSNRPIEQREIELLINNPEVRSMTIATNQAGGFLVPTYWEATLIEKLASANVMRTLADVLPLQSGDRKLPIVTDKGQAAWIGEGQPYPASDIALDNILLGGYKLARIIQVSEELVNDSVVNIDSMIMDAFVQSFANMEEDAFINGWTSTQDRPTGILGRASLGVTGASATAVTTDEIYDLFYKLKRPYRAKASWLLNDQTIKAVRKLKTSDGQYIWSPGFGTEPPTLLGRPVFTSESMPTMMAGKRSILFGDFSYYKIADRQGRVMQRLNEKYADVGNVGFRMFQRVDGNLALPEAVQALQNAAV